MAKTLRFCLQCFVSNWDKWFSLKFCSTCVYYIQHTRAVRLNLPRAASQLLEALSLFSQTCTPASVSICSHYCPLQKTIQQILVWTCLCARSSVVTHRLLRLLAFVYLRSGSKCMLSKTVLDDRDFIRSATKLFWCLLELQLCKEFLRKSPSSVASTDVDVTHDTSSEVIRLLQRWRRVQSAYIQKVVFFFNLGPVIFISWVF